MSKEMRNLIETTKNYGKIISEDLNLNYYSTDDEKYENIFNFIKHLPIKYKLKKQSQYRTIVYDIGIETALNNSQIARFYLAYHKNNKKTTSILPVPILSDEAYDKLNKIMKMCDSYIGGDHNPGISVLHIQVLKAMCHQMMDVILYVDYFNVKYNHGDPIKMINDIKIPKNENELYKLFKEFDDREGGIRILTFFADSNPIIKIIKNYK